MLRGGCERVNASSRCRDGMPVGEALAEDLAAMLALPGAPFDAARWVRARSDKHGYAEACGSRCCAGPAWHDRELLVGLRTGSVEILADRGRRVADGAAERGGADLAVCFRQDRSFMDGTQNFQAWHCKFSCSARHAA